MAGRADWSIVSTVDAPLWLLSMHARFLSRLGCRRIVYFLDNPGRYSDADLSGFPANVGFVRCDAAYWDGHGRRDATIIGRQLANLRHARRVLDGAFILHIDIDEFPMFRRDVGELLAELPDDVTSLRIQNAERVLVEGNPRWTEGILRMPVTKPGLVAEAYGPRSRYLGVGLASYVHGKSFTRIREDVIASVHGEFVDGRELTRAIAPLDQALLVHYDCISPTHWAWKILVRVREVQFGRRMFPHERRMLDHVIRSPDRASAVRALVALMHTASREEARRWLRARVARPLPAAFVAQLAAAAGDSALLDRDLADRSLADFYAVPPEFRAVGRSLVEGG